MPERVRLVTYNIRKGKGASGRDRQITALGRALAAHKLDIVLCQEVFHTRTPGASQSALLAQALDMTAYYEPNKHRRIGHHGNATFTRLHVEALKNYDISTNRIERRGALHLKLRVGNRLVHVINVHLGLNERQRIRQLSRIETIIALSCAAEDAVILAGDFNDWTRRLDYLATHGLGLENAFSHLGRAESGTWHARRPLFNLDRVYLRNVKLRRTRRLSGHPWRDLSDHLPLWVEIEI